jgi:Tol biopolymer transport system component/tRNA A-37 threonylcarbamoyl transferase component Bud32
MERWQQIESLFQEALQCDPAERDAYLQEACHGDTDLQREVASLLANHQAATDFKPWAAAAAAQLIDGRVSLHAGERLGPYEIVVAIGTGGMGEVYRARDPRMGREVAIKIAAERFSDRFEREVHAVAALNHPNICQIYDVGPNYLVMEYVQGKTLDALIRRKGMPLSELLKIAIQVADGLNAAHAAGIIHRDLKPSNIMVSDSGLVKILDFGLAKLTERAEVTEDAPTHTLKPETMRGAVLGTAAYMSPEQAEGKLVDARSDIFSFGAVLYEMATGRRAFAGGSQAAILAAVLNKEPRPPREVTPEAPAELERVILRLLRKDPGKRQQHMTDVKVLLEELREESESGKLAPRAAAKSRRWPWVVAPAVLALAAGAAWWFTRGREESPPRVVPLTTFAGSEMLPAFSPDGNQVVFCWNGEKQDNWDLYVKMIGSATALRLTTDPGADLYPAWSPDGARIAFLKGERVYPWISRGIYWISPLGGPEQKIADFDAAPGAPAWSADGKFLVVAKYHLEHQPAADAGALFLLPIEGGEPRPLLTPVPGRWYAHPAIAPDSRSLAFESCRGVGGALYCDLLVVRLNGDLTPQGNPRQLAAGLGNAVLAWTPDGRSLVYSASSSSQESFLYRVDLAGGESKRLEIASRRASSPAVARKGNRLAFSRSVFDRDVWRLAVGGKPQPFLVSTAADKDAQFSPDGRRIAFASERGGEGIAIWLANADGAGLVQLTRGPYHGSPSWSPDGRWIAFDARGKEGRWSINVVDSSGGPSRLLAGGPFSSVVPSWSHNGKWIYFNSDRSGRFEIWRMPFQGGAAEQVTRDGGYVARESTDGRTLYYTKTGGNGPLFGRPLSGGDEKQVLEMVEERGFVALEDGIYYLYPSFLYPGGEGSEIRFHEFATGHKRTISHIEGQLDVYLSVSRDRKTFLFTLSASAGSDLMLIENFR